MLSDLKPPLTLICHDAGAANHLIAWLAASDCTGLQLRAFMQGPAAVLWQRAFPNFPLEDDLHAALSGARTLVSGTGWASTLEHDARSMAAELGLQSIAILDHWVNYCPRFERSGSTVLPDEFWVADGDALALARATFPDKPVRQLPNLYLQSQLAAVDAIERIGMPSLLYLCEPMRNHWNQTELGEFQALEYFVAKIDKLGLPPSTAIKLRLHPSETQDKYDAWITAHAHLGVELDQTENLSAALANADWVVGCESYALTLALAAGCNVYCALPPWAPACRLPHVGIRQIRDLA